jgi:esterase/lipase superfamily enzyme
MLAYGSAAIRVPDAHKIGQVERASDSDWTIFGITLWETKPDEKKHFVAKQFVGLSKDQFVDVIKRSKNDGALLFVHGIATPFPDAIFKTAQIAFDTNFPGVPITFAWPTTGTWQPWDYNYDRESALYSRDAFLDTLRLIHNDAGISKLCIIAHSMGNQIVVDALAHAQGAGIGIAELVMAAPDVDNDVFRSMVTRLRTAAKGLTLYVSSADKAMLASRLNAGGAPRAGDVPADGPLVADGVDTIDVTAVGDDLFALNHSVYSSNRALLDDIGRILLTSTRPPDVRSPQLRRVPERSEHPRYWRYAE